MRQGLGGVGRLVHIERHLRPPLLIVRLYGNDDVNHRRAIKSVGIANIRFARLSTGRRSDAAKTREKRCNDDAKGALTGQKQVVVASSVATHSTMMKNVRVFDACLVDSLLPPSKEPCRISGP